MSGRFLLVEEFFDEGYSFTRANGEMLVAMTRNWPSVIRCVEKHTWSLRWLQGLSIGRVKSPQCSFDNCVLDTVSNRDG